MIDLDRFKEINDTLGHHNGDLLLCTIGERLTATLRASDSVARLGGDEFAVLLTDIGGTEDALDAATRVRAAISRRLELEDIGVEIEASVGIALYPEHGEDPETLLQHADVAMYTAKRAHSGQALYDGTTDAYNRENLELIADLRRAIDEDQLVLHFQPKADLASGTAVGVEALVRWQHPERGFLYPDAFIALAENTGLIRPLTLHVLHKALAQTRAWNDQGLVARHGGQRLHAQPARPHAPGRGRSACSSCTRVPAHQLELEITETTIMADPPRAKAVLARLSALGVGLAVDDFGTGYTSLSWLRDLPLSTLKIDKSFVLKMSSVDGDAKIVRSTVQLGRSLGLKVVAEGVEDEASWDELKALGCSLAQGYYYSRPQAEARADALAADRRQHVGHRRGVRRADRVVREAHAPV